MNNPHTLMQDTIPPKRFDRTLRVPEKLVSRSRVLLLHSVKFVAYRSENGHRS